MPTLRATLHAITATLAASVLLASPSAHATNCGQGGTTHWDETTWTCQPNAGTTSTPAGANAASNSSSNSSSAADSTSTGGQASAQSTATGGAAAGGNASNDHRYYVLPAPVQAAPLPSGFCTYSQAYPWSLGWNAVSAAPSSSRIDIDNIDACIRLLRAARSLSPAQMAGEACGADADCIARMMRAFALGSQIPSPAQIAAPIALRSEAALASPAASAALSSPAPTAVAGVTYRAKPAAQRRKPRGKATASIRTAAAPTCAAVLACTRRAP